MVSKALVQLNGGDVGRCGHGVRMLQGGGGILCYDEEVG